MTPFEAQWGKVATPSLPWLRLCCAKRAKRAEVFTVLNVIFAKLVSKLAVRVMETASLLAEFNSRAGQMGRNVANGSPLLRFFFEAAPLHALSSGDEPLHLLYASA